MVNRWIVTNHVYVQHDTPERAVAERERLQKLHPEKTFHLHRIEATIFPRPGSYNSPAMSLSETRSRGLRVALALFLAAVALGAVLLALVFFTAPAQAVSFQLVGQCWPRGELVTYLDKSHSEHPVSIGMERGGSVIEVFLSDAGTFSIVMTRPDGNSCLLAAGDDWEDLPVRMTDGI